MYNRSLILGMNPPAEIGELARFCEPCSLSFARAVRVLCGLFSTQRPNRRDRLRGFGGSLFAALLAGLVGSRWWLLALLGGVLDVIVALGFSPSQDRPTR
jgi:hypothetical protein